MYNNLSLSNTGSTSWIILWWFGHTLGGINCQIFSIKIKIYVLGFTPLNKSSSNLAEYHLMLNRYCKTLFQNQLFLLFRGRLIRNQITKITIPFVADFCQYLRRNRLSPTHQSLFYYIMYWLCRENKSQSTTKWFFPTNF